MRKQLYAALALFLALPVAARAQVGGSPGGGGLPPIVAPTIVQEVAGPAACAASPVSITFGATPTVGNLIVVIAASAGGNGALLASTSGGFATVPGSWLADSTGSPLSTPATGAVGASQHTMGMVFAGNQNWLSEALVRPVVSGDGTTYTFNNGIAAGICIYGMEVSGASSVHYATVESGLTVSTFTLLSPLVQSFGGKDVAYEVVQSLNFPTDLATPSGWTLKLAAEASGSNTAIFKRNATVGAGIFEMTPFSATTWNGSAPQLLSLLTLSP